MAFVIRNLEIKLKKEYIESVWSLLVESNITCFEEDSITHRKQEFKHFGVWVKQKQ